METFLYITAVYGVYLGIGVFVVGMAWRTYQWVTTPKSPVRLGMFPKPKTGAGRVLKMLKDTLIAPQSARIEPLMWAFAFAFHVAALGAFIGHGRLLHEFTPLVTWLGEDGMNTFAAWSGGTAGIVMLAAVVFWIARRTFGPFKQLSVPEDYLLLALLFGVIIMGDHMRFVGTIHAETYREWFQSLLVFKPEIPAEILGSSTGWSLGGHMLFTDLFLIYFPFSKLVHAVGAFSANLVRSE